MRPRLLLLALLACVFGWVIGCTGSRVTVGGGASYRYPHQVANGRPLTCPEVRLPPLRDGGVSPDAARCSYADAQGSPVVHVGGKVLTEGEGGGDPGVGVADVAVTIHRLAGVVLNLEDPGPAIAHARTDAQGSYSISGTFPPGNFAAIAREKDGRLLAYRVFVITEGATGRIDNIRITVPADPRLAPAEVLQPSP